LARGPPKRIGYLPDIDKEPKPRTNKKLEQRILTILGVEEMRNVYTNSRGSISPLQVSKQVPDLVLRSFEDIQDTMYNMKEKGLLHKIESNVRVGTVESEEEETQFQISGKGIVQFRKSLRPIAKLAVNHEKQYRDMVEKTKGDPEVKAELRKLPDKIKNNVDGYPKVKAEVKKVPKKILKKFEDKLYGGFVDIAWHYGGAKLGIFITRFLFGDANDAG
jgi:hypothetical protein